jgi:hypothetical protein
MDFLAFFQNLPLSMKVLSQVVFVLLAAGASYELVELAIRILDGYRDERR